MKYTLTDDSERKSYFFTHNSFGDIIGIYSGSGVLTAQYEYDAWGKVISITDGNGNEITDTNNIGLLNPFRYRGYYYDSDTGLYYLMSRYYDPVTCRFINADVYFQSGGSILDANMSAYCRNNPISFYDPMGTDCICMHQRVRSNHLCNESSEKEYVASYKPSKEPIDSNNPPDHPNYTPHKKGNNGKVKNPNGAGKGWLADNGGVWIPTPNMHGGPGWTIQYPDGSHEHAYPGGKMRRATKESNPVGGTVLLILGTLGTAYLVGNDVTGVLIADDTCIPITIGCIAFGINEIGGKYTCECGESWYGFK